MTKWFALLQSLLLIAVATVAVTAFAQGMAAEAHTNSLRVAKCNLLSATIDFGAGTFTGNHIWLGVNVSPAGSNASTDLSVPPAAKLPTPYAMMAYTASTLLGRLPGTQFKGTINTSPEPIVS